MELYIFSLHYKEINFKNFPSSCASAAMLLLLLLLLLLACPNWTVALIHSEADLIALLSPPDGIPQNGGVKRDAFSQFFITVLDCQDD
jgi:hypothetical protein